MCKGSKISLATCICYIKPSSKKSCIPNRPRPPELRSRDSIPQRFRVGLVQSVGRGRPQIPEISTRGFSESWRAFENVRVQLGMLLFFDTRCIDAHLFCHVFFIIINQGGGAQHLEFFDPLGSEYRPIKRDGTYPPRQDFLPGLRVSPQPIRRAPVRVILCGLVVPDRVPIAKGVVTQKK